MRSRGVLFDPFAISPTDDPAGGATWSTDGIVAGFDPARPTATFTAPELTATPGPADAAATTRRDDDIVASWEKR